MSDLPNVPIVQLPGAEGWERAYNWGRELDAAFPNQDAEDFAIGCSENDYGPTLELRVIGLVMLQQGEQDGADWKWRVTMEDGSAWIVVGGCDYTGWDCQSSLTWDRDDTALPDLVRQALAADSTEQSDDTKAQS